MAITDPIRIEYAPAPPKPPRFRLSAGEWLVLVLAPILLLVLPLPPTKGKWAIHKQDWILGATLILAVASLALYLIPTKLFPTRRSIWPLIVLGTSLLVAANIAWNKEFRKYCQKHPDYHREVFRAAMQKTLHWPVYGRYDNAIARYDPATKRYSFATLPFVLLSSGIAAGWFVWMRRRPLDRPWDVKSLALLIVFQFALILAFALCDPGSGRLSLNTSGYGEFAKDLHRFKGIFNTFQYYVERMPTLEWYGQHYPPGNLILLKIEAALHLPGLTKAIVILATVLSVVPLYGLTKELDLSDTAASATLLLFAASTSVLILCTINTTSLLLLPGTVCLWMLVRALRTGSYFAAHLLGLSYFSYLMFSFSASILGVLMTLVAALGLWRSVFKLRDVVLTALIAGATLLAATAAIYALTHFNLVACFIAAVHGHHEQQGNGGFDDPSRFLLRSTGNLIAYLLSTVPLCVLAVGALKRNHPAQDDKLARTVFLALAITLVVAGFSGLFYLETERIWIFLTPTLALAAGYEAARRNDVEGPRLIVVLVLLVLVISCSQEFLFMHYR